MAQVRTRQRYRLTLNWMRTFSLKSLGHRYLERHDEIADRDMMIGAIVQDLAPELVARDQLTIYSEKSRMSA